MGIHITYRPPAMTTCIHLSCTVISQEGPEGNSAYEQLLSRLGEITEKGQLVGLAPHPCHKEPSLGSLRSEDGEGLPPTEKGVEV